MESGAPRSRSRRSDRVSVVLATFNGADFLPEQLASLLSQSRPPDELVIVDDASTDGTPALLADFAEHAPFDVDLVLRSEHLGTWTTFEEGVRRASGDLIVICDQDDRWRSDKLAVLVPRLTMRPDAVMAFSDARLIDSSGALIGRSRWRVAGFSPQAARHVAVDPIGPLFSRQAVSGCTLAFRSELLGALLPFPIDLHPGLPVMMYDRWITLMAAIVGPVVPVPERLVDYRIHPGQQIGIPALKIRKIAPRVALRAAQFLHGRAEQDRRMGYHLAHFDEIEKRLDAAGMSSPASEARLASARAHVEFRASLAPSRRSRVRAVAAELRSDDGYRRFSLGVASAMADIAR